MFNENFTTPSLTGGRNDSHVLPNLLKRFSDFDSPFLRVSEGHETRCHWITATFRGSLQIFKDILSSLIFLPNDSIKWFDDVPFFCGVSFNFSGASPSGLKFAYNNLPDAGKDNVHGIVVIPGSFLDGLTSVEGFSIVVMLARFGLKFTRIDSVFIDYDRRLYPNQVYEFCCAGLLRGPRKFSYISGDSVYHPGLGELVNRGDTCQIGSRKSDKFLRIYDAAWLHKVKAIRWELELKGKCAELFVDRLLGFWDSDKTYDELLAMEPVLMHFVNSTIFGNFTFVDSDYVTEAHLNRCEMLPVWADFLDFACHGNTIKTNPVRPVAGFAKKLAWLARQVSKSLALCKEVYRSHFPQFISELLLVGSRKITDFDESWINFLQYGCVESQ